jgi:hypothetical protein
LRRWAVVLHALKVADDIFGALLLLIDNAFEVVVLLIDLLHDFFFQADLAGYASLHPGALRLMLAASIQYLIELGDSLLCGHLECLDFERLIC